MFYSIARSFNKVTHRGEMRLRREKNFHFDYVLVSVVKYLYSDSYLRLYLITYVNLIIIVEELVFTYVLACF